MIQSMTDQKLPYYKGRIHKNPNKTKKGTHIMSTVSKNVTKMVNQISRRTLTNDSQRALLTLLKPRSKDGWVARTAIPVNSIASVRSLRTSKFGGFDVECVTAGELKEISPRRSVSSSVTDQQTFYRVVPSSVTESSLRVVFKGVIS